MNLWRTLMNTPILLAADLAAIFLLTFGLYLRRHRRRDLVVSYLGMNVGVFAVATALSGSAAGVGLGLGLFGVLSIIRLRSTELEQHEVAYYFSALAMGLIGGLGTTPLWLASALMALILAVMYVGDHPRVLPSYRHQTVVLDRAINREGELHARLAEVLGGRVHTASVQELDLVNDRTTVNVRYSVLPDPVAGSLPDAGAPVISSAGLRVAGSPVNGSHLAGSPAAGPPAPDPLADREPDLPARLS
jgi:hypothetical protein